MVAGIVCVAAAFAWVSQLGPGDSYVRSILPAAVLWGIGLGLAVTPLTSAVLAAVRDKDLGEASAINDAASRLGGVIAIAVVPALVGFSGGSFAKALESGYRPAMLVLAALAAAGALVTALFVSDDRAPAPQFAAPAPQHGCVLPTGLEQT
jgi:uncharacterized YccA/Bax inhibitor family protein